MSHKYDLLTVETGDDSPQRHYPWYKERLKLKFLKTSKYCNSLDGAKWRFIPSSVDDFRNGLPRKQSQVVKKKEVNPVPIVSEKPASAILRKIESKVTSTKGGIISGNPGLRTLYKRVGPRQQLQEECIDALESSLLEHPLALYPHLEEAIPPDIVDDVVDILDPDMNEVISNSEGSSPTDTATESRISRDDTRKSSEPSQSILIRAPSSVDGEDLHEGKEQSNMYKFPLIKTEEEIEREQNLIASQQVISAKQQSRVKQVTRDLVQWGEQLGGSEKSAYIDEQTIKSLFGSNYETKPILMAPIQVVELTNIPPELQPDSRGRSANSGSTQARRRRAKGIINYYGYQRVGSKGTDNWPWLDITVPQVVRTKYGAWYLPVRLWKVSSSDEPLRNPDLERGELECEQAQRKMEMDEKVSALHGAKAFKEFIITNQRGIMPPFLNSVKLNSPPAPSSRRKFTYSSIP